MTVIRIKSDTTSNLTGTTPSDNEIIHDSVANTLYIGDGATTFASLTAVGGGGGGGGITSVIQDTTPQLGGDLDAQSYNISSVNTLTASSIVKSGGSPTEFLKADGSVDSNTYITAVTDDGSPVLGGSLTLDQHGINTQVRNDSGSDISAGTPVYITGYHAGSSKPLIAPANASSIATMPAFGIVENTITNGTEGVVAVMGIVSGLDTTSPVSFSVGDMVYVNTGGGITNVRPTGVSDQIQNLGKVTKAHSTNGRILLLGAGRSNDVPNSGTFEKVSVNDGAILPSSVPSSTTNTLYNDGSRLSFDGSPLIESDVTGITGTVSGVYNIVIVDQTTYDNITTKDPNTIYFVP